MGRHPRVRHGRPLQPRLRRRDARARRTPATSRSSASATRARPRSPRRPTASSPAGRPRASRSPGPGSTNLLTGLYDAKVDRAPVLAISGQVPSKVLGRGAFQDVDLTAAFADVARLLEDRAAGLRPRRADDAWRSSTRSSSATSRTSCSPTRCRSASSATHARRRRRSAASATTAIAPPAAALDDALALIDGARRPGRSSSATARASRWTPCVALAETLRRAGAHDVQGQGPGLRPPPARRRRARPQRHAGRELADERVRPAASCSARRSRTTPASRRTSRSCRSTSTRWRSAASTR